MNLYFQVLTQNQSLSVLQLLQFVSFAVSSDRSIAGTAKLLTGPKIATFKFSSLEELIAKSSKRKFNELEVKYSPDSFDLDLFDSSHISATGLFKPAASSSIWFASSEWPPGGDRSVRNRKMNAKAAEMALQYNQVQKPSVFELVLELSTKLSPDEVLDKISKRLTYELSAAFHEIEPFGCCDWGGSEFFVRLESSVLMTEHIRIFARIPARDYPKLGLRFDRLHPLIFGNNKLCTEISSEVGEDAQLVYGSGKNSWGVLKLTSECDVALANKRASRWLLIDSVDS